MLRLLSPEVCIEIMKDTLVSLEQGEGVQYLRTPLRLPNHEILGFMPAWLNQECFGAKIITVYHSNQASEYPSHQGSILLFGAQHGNLLAMVDATSITQIRTGAVSAFATDLLARQDADTLALVGSGMQAESHLKAIMCVRKLNKVWVWDLDTGRSRDFAARMSAETGLSVLACETAREAVAQADIICTLTPSSVPVIESAWVKEGAHLNAVGASLPTDREIPSDLMLRARVYGDSADSVLNESGDFLIPLNEGVYGREHLLGTVGAVALGQVAGRTDDKEVTLFEALGLAIEDIASAWHVYNAVPEN